MGSCVVSNPYEGIEEWFKPGREIFVVKDEEDAAKTYEWLIDNDSIRMETGQAARKRVIDQHTYTHRAREVLEVIKALQ
jgi:spore maturation protein CgeB